MGYFAFSWVYELGLQWWGSPQVGLFLLASFLKQARQEPAKTRGSRNK